MRRVWGYAAPAALLLLAWTPAVSAQVSPQTSGPAKFASAVVQGPANVANQTFGVPRAKHRLVGTNFTVWFDEPSGEALANRALASLDRAYWRIGLLLGAFPNQPISVVLCTSEEFSAVAQAPLWATGAYDGTIRLPVRDALKDPIELDRVLAHEVAHALVGALAPHSVPVWLNEGIAAALEADDLDWAERRVRDAAAPVPLHELTTGFSRLNSDEAGLAYAAAALWVRELLDTAGGSAIANLLRDLGEGVDIDTSFQHRVQRRLADLARP